MPGCAAVGCNNRSEKGFIMKCFPRDPKLRKIWQDRVARADWEPSNNSFLCHVHFELEEWSITQNGRVRLKKDAIPSIFTVTSTRKSAKKRIKLANVKNENDGENDYMTESLENDTEHSSIGHPEEKDSDSQDVANPSVQSLVYQQANHSPIKIENKPFYGHDIDITNDLQRENVIIISDDTNMELEGCTKGSDAEKQGTHKSHSNFRTKRTTADNQSGAVAVKTEIKRDIDCVFNDSYDEIEEKLKQICDGHREENNISNMEELTSYARSRNRKGTFEKSVTSQMPLHKSINYKCSSRNEIGDMLTDNRDNIEIIFGSESGEDVTRVPWCTVYNSGTMDVTNVDQHNDTTVDSIRTNKEMDGHARSADEPFTRETIHVASSNERTAAQCKLRIQEEGMMKSVKSSVQSAAIKNITSMSNSDISDVVDTFEHKIKEELNVSEITQYAKDATVLNTTKFIIKVTGDREDVSDIMQDLFKDTKTFTIQEHNDTCLQKKGSEYVTSIITIDDCPIETMPSDKCNNDRCSSPTTITSIASRDNNRVSVALSTLKNNECPTTRLLTSHMDEERDLDMSNARDSVTEQSTITVYTGKCEYEKLQKKVKLQETVIKRLTNQLILLKDSEKKLQNTNLVLKARTKKIEKKMSELNKSTDGGTPSSTDYKQTDMRQKLIYDLSNRMNNLEETNKKLMKTITIECQQKRQLESQIKQRDKRIKELNWKLEKASKYLERAEKNTNTYKRKMLNMQTFMRRKKLLDGNTCKFHEIMIDSMKEDYSERVVAMAMEIKEICGANGYEKLLNYGFPLPACSVLQPPPSDDISDSSKVNDKIKQAASLKQTTNEERDTQPVENDVRYHHQPVEDFRATSLCEETVMDNIETVMGTVQDIFEESNNDVDDFSTNDLKEHFILQLNAVM